MSDPVTQRKATSQNRHPPDRAMGKISGHVTEGPFMLKHNGVYYLMYSGTGADSPNYGIGYAMANSPLGPFEKFSSNPIVQRGGKSSARGITA